jgi:hypothetical protein
VRARLASASWEVVAAALCLPLLLLHVRWQPGVTVRAGSTSISIVLSDLAVLAIAVLALVAGVRRGFAPLRAGRALWIAAALFLVWVLISVGIGASRGDVYPWRTHAVTAAKIVEYAMLAPALALLLRRRVDLLVVLWSAVAWGSVASAVAVLQFAGVDIAAAAARGSRQPSFLSDSDFAALSAAVLLVGIVAAVASHLRLGRTMAIAAVVAGAIGVALAAAVASVLGLITAAILLLTVPALRETLTARRVGAVAAAAALAVLTVLVVRGGDIGSFARFVGASGDSKHTTVQTYAHHTVLAWIGLRIWEDHPLLGAGFEASGDPATFGPYVRAARSRFPDQLPTAFPSSTRLYGVQNSWVQALADLGVVGLALFTAVFATAVIVARRAATAPALVGLAWTGLVAWLWVAQGLVAGIPLDAVTWLGFGLAGAGAAWKRADV